MTETSRAWECSTTNYHQDARGLVSAEDMSQTNVSSVGAQRDKRQQLSNSIYWFIVCILVLTSPGPRHKQENLVTAGEETCKQVPMQAPHPDSWWFDCSLCRAERFAEFSLALYLHEWNLFLYIQKLNLRDVLRCQCLWCADEGCGRPLISDSALDLWGSGLSLQVYDWDILVLLSDEPEGVGWQCASNNTAWKSVLCHAEFDTLDCCTAKCRFKSSPVKQRMEGLILIFANMKEDLLCVHIDAADL